jgi:hypothetical protein
MKLLNKRMILLSTLMVSGIVMAGHHEKGEAIAPAASAGQIMMMYHWPCADNDEGMSSLKGLITSVMPRRIRIQLRRQFTRMALWCRLMCIRRVNRWTKR